ncbi:hypothetical protein [Anaerobacillus alkalidiazotrophicus]
MVGKGLSIPLDSFTCRVINDQFFFTVSEFISRSYFRFDNLGYMYIVI